MKIAFCTLGCKVNQYETDKLKGQAENAGFEIVSFDTIADIYCINSCSVTNMSQRKSRQMVGHARRINPNAIVAILGCGVESAKEDIESLKADIVIGNEDKENFIQIVKEYKKGRYITDISKVTEYSEKQLLLKAYDVREAVKIEDGCNNFCSYCIIPYLRGRVRSKNIEQIEQEVKNMVSQNVKEIVLVGIEVASYGKDLEQNISLIDVIERVDKIEGVERLRLGSLEPRFLTEENILRLSKCKTLCPHFHISMQSGCTEVLKSMNRKYDATLLVNVCNMLHSAFPACYIAADVIVGFPGETEEHFNKSIETIQEMGLNELHVFKYSKRAYTRAAKFENQIDGSVKKVRSEKLIAISNAEKDKFLQRYIGKTVKVLFEEVNGKYLLGYTPNYIKVEVEGESSLCGTIQDVALISLGKEEMKGQIV